MPTVQGESTIAVTRDGCLPELIDLPPNHPFRYGTVFVGEWPDNLLVLAVGPPYAEDDDANEALLVDLNDASPAPLRTYVARFYFAKGADDELETPMLFDTHDDPRATLPPALRPLVNHHLAIMNAACRLNGA